jgi:hypothetical protein
MFCPTAFLMRRRRGQEEEAIQSTVWEESTMGGQTEQEARTWLS